MCICNLFFINIMINENFVQYILKNWGSCPMIAHYFYQIWFQVKQIIVTDTKFDTNKLIWIYIKLYLLFLSVFLFFFKLYLILGFLLFFFYFREVKEENVKSVQPIKKRSYSDIFGKFVSIFFYNYISFFIFHILN